MKKKAQSTPAIVNRRARFDYELGEELTTGVVLSGAEVKAVRRGHAQLKGAFVTIKDGELWLNNLSLTVLRNLPGSNEPTVDSHPRKLLVHSRELKKLSEAKKQGMTIIPVRMLPTARYIKVVIALAKGKKRYEKRETIRRRDLERESQRALKH